MGPSSRNFDFLKAFEPELARLGALAEWAFHQDAPTALGKLRQFAEHMAKSVVARNGLVLERRASFERELTKVVEAAVADLAARAPVELAPVHVTKPVEVSKGEGLGTLGDVEEGRRSLDATAISMRLEDWAGPVGGPRDIETKFGTKRSTLHDWQKRGAVIGLLKGARKHVFPLAQFVDGRPVEGMTAVTRIIKNPRVAWQWLIQRKPSIGGSPLDRLKKGRLDEVVAAAQRDFG